MTAYLAACRCLPRPRRACLTRGDPGA
jgi:hypothetical protein